MNMNKKYHFEIKEYKNGKKLPIMRFEDGEGCELITEFLFANVTSSGMADIILENFKEVINGENVEINSDYNGINLKIMKNESIISRDNGEDNDNNSEIIEIDTEEMLEIIMAYREKVIQLRQANKV